MNSKTFFSEKDTRVLFWDSKRKKNSLNENATILYEYF